jgi:hypothetical protein
VDCKKGRTEPSGSGGEARCWLRLGLSLGFRRAWRKQS